MKNIITANKGFYFNEETKKLESYELVKVEFTLAEDAPTYYHCKLGGVDKVIKTDHLVLFENAAAFECGNHIHSKEVNGLHNFRTALPFNINTGWVWAFVDGMAKQVDAATIGLTYDGFRVYVTSGEKYYGCKSDVYKWHDYVVKEADGSERTVVSPANIIALTDEHKKLVDEWESLYDKMTKAGLRLLYDTDSGDLRIYHKNDSADIQIDYCNLDEEGFTECREIPYCSKVSATYFCGDDGLWVKSK